VALNVERKSAPAAGITHTVYPVPHEMKSYLLLKLLRQGSAKSVLVFTRTKHRANRLADFLERNGIACARIHGNRSQMQRTEALEGFKRGRFRVLVATDIAARGIDVEALELVVNFDVPHLPEDYIHRVGRTARVEATGDAYTFLSPEEEGAFRAIERHLGKHLPREKVAGFDYESRPTERLEVPLAERIAAIRKRKADERARARVKDERRATQGLAAHPSGAASAWGSRSGNGQRRSAKAAPGLNRAEAVLAWARQATGRPDHSSGGGHGHRHGGGSPAFRGKSGYPR
jgi:ATP-dependent RNA helicase RhlE